MPGGISFTGTYTVTGGTGRFTALTADGFLAGSALLNEPHSGIGSFASRAGSPSDRGIETEEEIDPGPNSIPGPGSGQDTLTRTRT